MAGISFRERVIQFLKSRETKKKGSVRVFRVFTARQIVEELLKESSEFKKQFDNKIRTSKRTEQEIMNEMISRVISEGKISARKHLEFRIITSPSPRKFYWASKYVEKKAEEEESGGKAKGSKQNYNRWEKELYKPLMKYLKDELGVHSERIREGKSSNSRGKHGNQFLHPDIVGVESLVDPDWIAEVEHLAGLTNSKKARIWSFEVKKAIESSNVRASFLQAVSNSSWANFGYLVAEKIEDPETEKELRMLASLHGIGVIIFNAEEQEGDIKIQARERDEIDLVFCNRLANENGDFKKFLRNAQKEYK